MAIEPVLHRTIGRREVSQKQRISRTRTAPAQQLPDDAAPLRFDMKGVGRLTQHVAEARAQRRCCASLTQAIVSGVHNAPGADSCRNSTGPPGHAPSRSAKKIPAFEDAGIGGTPVARSAIGRRERQGSSELPLRLRGTAALAGRVKASLAITGGVHTGVDVIKATMAGAHATQLVSALLRHGPRYLRTLRTDLESWMREHEWASLNEMRGNMSLQRIPDPGAYERANFRMALR